MQKDFMIKYLLFAFSVFFATLLFLSNLISCPMSVQLVLGCLTVGFIFAYERYLYERD